MRFLLCRIPLITPAPLSPEGSTSPAAPARRRAAIERMLRSARRFVPGEVVAFFAGFLAVGQVFAEVVVAAGEVFTEGAEQLRVSGRSWIEFILLSAAAGTGLRRSGGGAAPAPTGMVQARRRHVHLLVRQRHDPGDIACPIKMPWHRPSSGCGCICPPPG